MITEEKRKVLDLFAQGRKLYKLMWLESSRGWGFRRRTTPPSAKNELRAISPRSNGLDSPTR